MVASMKTVPQLVCCMWKYDLALTVGSDSNFTVGEVVVCIHCSPKHWSHGSSKACRNKRKNIE